VIPTDERPLWFKARRYGWGWTPASVEGRIITIVVAIALVAGNYVIGTLASPAGGSGARDDLMPRLSGSALLVALVVWNALVLIPAIWICWKTGERPRWRWGGR
jgi:hypothetical protein